VWRVAIRLGPNAALDAPEQPKEGPAAMTRAASLVLRVVGLALVLVAVMGFVLVGTDGTWTARTQVPAGRTALLLEPSVVSVLGPSVTVRVEPADASSRAELFLGRGRSDDLTAYAQDANVSRVVGLSRSRELDVRDGPGSVAALPQVTLPSASPTGGAISAPVARRRPPTAVDVWEQQVSGPRARELSWRPTPGAQSVLVAAEDGMPLPALDVEVAWTDHSWLWIPAVVLALGIALIVAGVVVGGGLSRLPLALAVARPRAVPRRSSGGGRRHGPKEEVSTGAVGDPAPGRASGPAAGPAPGSAPGEASKPARTQGIEPATVLAPPVADASADVVPATRREARARRRKQTVWSRARSRARAVAPAAAWARRGRWQVRAEGRTQEEQP
jgi:hypothetical protein